MNILETDSVQLSFNGRMVLNNIYLSCRTGEIVGLIGRNGSGKSSLLKIIFGTLRGENQSVRINRHFHSRPYAGGRIKYLPQDGFLPSYLRVGECLDLMADKSIPIDEWDELKNIGNQRIGALSGGQQKLLELLLILYSDADFILLDEPFSFLAPVTIDKINPLIRVQSENKGIILTDHMYHAVLETVDRLYLVQQGILNEIEDPRHLSDLGYLPTQ